MYHTFHGEYNQEAVKYLRNNAISYYLINAMLFRYWIYSIYSLWKSSKDRKRFQFLHFGVFHFTNTYAKKYFQNQQALVIVFHEKCDTYTQIYRHFSGVFNLVT